MYILYIWENREYIVLIPKCLVLVRIWMLAVCWVDPGRCRHLRQVAPSQPRAGRAGCICSVLPKAPPFNVTVFSKQVRWAQEDSWIVCQDFAWHQRSFFSIQDNSLEVQRVIPGNSQIAIEQMCCFVLFFLYELPIFAIQNFVNMQISFIVYYTFSKILFGEKS